MNWELILWLLSGIVVSELIFIFWYKHIIKRGDDNLLYSIYSDDWILVKCLSYLIGGVIMLLQAFIVFNTNDTGTGFGTHRDYIYLLYELIILVIILFLTYGNKLIVNWIKREYTKKGKKKEKKR